MSIKELREINFDLITKAKVVCELDCTWAQIYDLGTLLCNAAIEQMKARQPRAQDDASLPTADTENVLDATPAI